MKTDSKIGEFRRAGGMQADRRVTPGQMGWMLTAGAAALALLLGQVIQQFLSGDFQIVFSSAAIVLVVLLAVTRL